MLKFIEVTTHSATDEGEKRIINLAHIVQVTPSIGNDWSQGAYIRFVTGDAFHLADADTTRVLDILRGVQ